MNCQGQDDKQINILNLLDNLTVNDMQKTMNKIKREQIAQFRRKISDKGKEAIQRLTNNLQATENLDENQPIIKIEKHMRELRKSTKRQPIEAPFKMSQITEVSRKSQKRRKLKIRQSYDATQTERVQTSQRYINPEEVKVES